jgi:hypothetical protein
MSKIVTTINAVVEHVTDLKEGQYGVYKSVLFVTPQGESIWKSFSPDSPEMNILAKGTQVRLIPNGSTKSGKPRHVIELVDSSLPPNAAGGQVAQEKQGSSLSDDQKRAIAAYIAEQTQIYRFCYGEAVRALQGMGAQEGVFQSCAYSLFSAAQRKFDL